MEENRKQNIVRRWFGRLKLMERLMIIYGLILALCFLFCTLTLRRAFDIYDGKLYEKSLQELDFFTQQVNASLDEVEDLSYYIAIDTKIQEQLSTIQELRHFTAEYTKETHDLRMLLNNELVNSDMISNIYYTDSDATKMTVGISTGNIPSGTYASLMEAIHAARGAYVMVPPTPDYPYLLSGREIRKHIDASLNYLGTILVTSDVAGMIERNIGALEAESSSLCVFGDQGLIYENQEGMCGDIPPLPGDKGYKIVKDGGQRYFLAYLKSSKTGWTYVNRFPYSQIYGQTQNLRTVLLAGFVILFAVFALALKKLVHENYEKQLLLRDTKYKMLQAQINPHFLYNTLNSINWTVRAGKNKEAGEMTVALGEILRAALSRQQYFTLEDEVGVLKKYIKIQEYRYRRRVEFHLQVETEGRYLIHHMTIQPLVENALTHGADQMLDTCVITVRVLERERDILIEVKDSGPGIAPEKLELVRTFRVEAKGHGIGLKNIYERLMMAFGQKAVFQIDSAPGEGTRVTIIIPKIEVEQNV